MHAPHKFILQFNYNVGNVAIMMLYENTISLLNAELIALCLTILWQLYKKFKKYNIWKRNQRAACICLVHLAVLLEILRITMFAF